MSTSYERPGYYLVEDAFDLGKLLFGLRPPPLRGLAESVFDLDEAKSPFPRGAVLTPRRATRAEAANEDGVILPSRKDGKKIEGRLLRLGPSDQFRVVDFQAWKAQLDAELKGEMPGQGGHDAEAFGELGEGDVLLYLQPEDQNFLNDVPPDDDGVPAVFVVAPASEFELVSQPGTGAPRKQGEDDVEFLARKYGVDMPRAEEVARQFYALAASGQLPDDIETIEDAIAAMGEELGSTEEPAEKTQRKAGAGRKHQPAKPIDPKKLALLPDLDDDDRQQIAQALRTAGFTEVDEPKAPVLPTSKFVVGLGPGPMQGYGERPVPERRSRSLPGMKPLTLGPMAGAKWRAKEIYGWEGDDLPELDPPEDERRGTLDDYASALGDEGGYTPFGKANAYRYLAAEAEARGFELPVGKVARQELGLDGTAPGVIQIKVRDLPYVTLMAFVMPKDNKGVIALAYGDKVGAKQQDKLAEVTPPDGPPDSEMEDDALALYLHNEFRAQFAANPETADYPAMAMQYLWPRISGYVTKTVRNLVSGKSTPEEIEDAIQQAAQSILIGADKGGRKYDARRSKLKSFLVTVAKSMLLDVGRKTKVRQRFAGDVARGLVPGREAAVVDMRQAESFRAMVDLLAEQQPGYVFKRYRGDQPPKLPVPAGAPPSKATGKGMGPRMPVPPSSAPIGGAAPTSGPTRGVAQVGKGWGEFLSRPFRRFGAGLRSAEKAARQQGFKSGFGDVIPPEVAEPEEIENELDTNKLEIDQAKSFYFQLRRFMVDAVTKNVPGLTTAGFDITQPIDLDPLVSNAQGVGPTPDEQEQFSEGFERVLMGFLKQSQTFVRLIAKLQNVADDLHELLVGTMGIGLQDVRRADSGASAAMAQWREAFKLAEELVQRPEPFKDWKSYVAFVENALGSIQRMFGGIEQAIESLEIAAERGTRQIARAPKGQVVLRKFTRGTAPALAARDFEPGDL